MVRPLNPGSIRLVPLGGLGEIGMNCLAVEQDDGILIVDCGTSFPHEDLGVDVLHPDFGFLAERRERIRGVFVTHGHEDHIGALPYLLEELDVPVWGPPHALSLVRARLAEHDFQPEDVQLHEARPGTTYEVGSFRVEPVRVSHSICEASALCIETSAGTILHTGDFNMDPDPPDGEPSDCERLRAIGDRGVELLMSDSTNVDTPERRGSERGVGAALEPLVLAAQQRVFIALFASNIQRPGFTMLSDLLRRGAILHTAATHPDIHTSGHGGRSEQQRMLELIRPKSFMPLHGTLHHLRRHAELARSVGVERVVVVENGTSVVLDDGGLYADEVVPHGKVAISLGGEVIDNDTLWRRAELGRNGVVTLSLALDKDGRVVAGPEVTASGVPLVDRDRTAKRAVAREALRALERARDYRGVDLVDELRRAVRRQIFDICGGRPVVEVHLLEADE